MKRTHSALLLRNLATSIQHSLMQQTSRCPARAEGMVQARSSAQLPIAQSHSSCTLNNQQKQNRVFILQKQITHLEKDLQSSKASIRSYTKELDEYECITRKIKNVEGDIATKEEMIERIRNQVCMISEQIQSKVFNAEERVTEKEFYQELVQTYCRQYQNQSQILMDVFRIQDLNCFVDQEVKEFGERIAKKKQDIQLWKSDKDFDLNQHRLKNDLKNVRMQLISFEDQCDSFCQKHQYRKLRELLCLFFKNYAKRNGISNSQAENGFDVFVCRQGLVDELSEFIRERLVYNKPKCEAIQKYLEGLTKMQIIFKKNSSEKNHKLYCAQMEEIRQLQSFRKEKEEERERNKKQIVELNKKIDELFGQESLAVIEYLRQKKNKYDIKQIKSTLKEKKKEQEKRISEIRQAKNRVKHLQLIIQKQNSQEQKYHHQDTIAQSTQQMFAYEQSLNILKQKRQKLIQQKSKLESLISNAISKWRQRDQNKVKLKHLYQELSQTKKSYHSSKVRKEPVKSVQNVRKSTQFPLAQSRQSKQSKNGSLISLTQSKSVLSLNNPYEKIMKRDTATYQPIMSDCQMILSKKLNAKHESKELTLNFNTQFKALQCEDLKESVIQRCNSKSELKKTSVSQKNKENDLWAKRSKNQSHTQTKDSFSMKPTAQKSKLSNSERASLSKLLISKFNR